MVADATHVSRSQISTPRANSALRLVTRSQESRCENPTGVTTRSKCGMGRKQCTADNNLVQVIPHATILISTTNTVTRFQVCGKYIQGRIFEDAIVRYSLHTQASGHTSAAVSVIEITHHEQQCPTATASDAVGRPAQSLCRTPTPHFSLTCAATSAGQMAYQHIKRIARRQQPTDMQHIARGTLPGHQR